jgi:hypothetical protein
MSFNVSNEVKMQLLSERIQALNIEGYQHELNKKSAESLENDEAVAQAESAIEVIKAAIEVHEAELAALA